MQIAHVIPQLRTTNLAAAIEFYTAKLGFMLEFQSKTSTPACSQGISACTSS
jgi:catechol 2,3-dioxygenase-like lactoylglutathione lyase family enzyme